MNMELGSWPSIILLKQWIHSKQSRCGICEAIIYFQLNLTDIHEIKNNNTVWQEGMTNFHTHRAREFKAQTIQALSHDVDYSRKW